jgi:hypothetical protein
MTKKGSHVRLCHAMQCSAAHDYASDATQCSVQRAPVCPQGREALLMLSWCFSTALSGALEWAALSARGSRAGPRRDGERLESQESGHVAWSAPSAGPAPATPPKPHPHKSFCQQVPRAMQPKRSSTSQPLLSSTELGAQLLLHHRSHSAGSRTRDTVPAGTRA